MDQTPLPYIIAEDVEVANTLNSFFENTVKTLGISIPSEYITDTSNENAVKTLGIIIPSEYITFRYQYP